LVASLEHEIGEPSSLRLGRRSLRAGLGTPGPHFFDHHPKERAVAITLEQAAEAIGRNVIYRSDAQRGGRDKRPPERGTIVRVGREYVFVRYERGTTAATSARDLDFEVPVDEDEQKDRMLDAREALRSFDEGGL
jgi:hypothetical protein